MDTLLILLGHQSWLSWSPIDSSPPQAGHLSHPPPPHPTRLPPSTPTDPQRRRPVTSYSPISDTNPILPTKPHKSNASVYNALVLTFDPIYLPGPCVVDHHGDPDTVPSRLRGPVSRDLTWPPWILARPRGSPWNVHATPNGSVKSDVCQECPGLDDLCLPLIKREGSRP